MDNNQHQPSLENSDNTPSPITQEQPTSVPSPSVPPAQQSSNKPLKPNKPSHLLAHLLLALLLLVILGAVAYGAYSYGKSKTKTVTVSTPAPSMASVTVPKGATLIEQCVPGLGAQYILPKNIPDGPIYNVYKGQVVGIEYMANLNGLTTSQAMDSFDLMGAKYDHVNISPMKAHAGLQINHYQIDFMFFSSSQASKITCSSSSSSAGGMSSMPM